MRMECHRGLPFSGIHTSERGGPPGRSGALTSIQEDSPALRLRTRTLESNVPLEVGGQTSCRSVRLRPRAPLCRREAIGYRKWSTSDQPDRLALTGGSAAGCKRGLAVPGFRRPRQRVAGLTDLHPAYRPSAALEYLLPLREVWVRLPAWTRGTAWLSILTTFAQG